MVESYKLTMVQWRKLSESGVFKDSRLEFRYGDIINMTPIGKEHVRAVTLLTKTLVLALGDRAFVSPQNALLLDEIEVYPDLAIHKETDNKALPQAKDTLWLIEVAKSSLVYDQTTKLGDYALAGIAEYWIVNLVSEQIEVYLTPYKASYQTKRLYSFKEALAPQCFPDLERVWLEGY